MRRWMAAFALLLGVHTARADDLVLRDMGSFHVGGKLVEITGKPERDVTFTAGGVPAHVDPNGTYMAGQMYVQYFLPADVGASFCSSGDVLTKQRNSGVDFAKPGAVTSWLRRRVERRPAAGRQAQ